MNRPKYLAVDFDNTLFMKNSWVTSDGNPNNDIIELIKVMQNNSWKIILWTARNGSALNEAILWCKENGLRIDYVNENPEAIIWFKKSIGLKKAGWSNKIFADIYLDDSSFNTEDINNEIKTIGIDNVSKLLDDFCEKRFDKMSGK